MGQGVKTKRIHVYSVNFYTMTSFQVECPNFITGFKSRMKYNEVCHADSIKMLEKLLGFVRYSKNSYSMDVGRNLC